MSSRWIDQKKSREILNSYFSMENGTWLCDKSRIFQSSDSCLYKFIHSYNSIKNKHGNENDKEPEEIILICQRFHSFFTTRFVLTIVIPLVQTTQSASMVLYLLKNNNNNNHLYYLEFRTFKLRIFAMYLFFTCEGIRTRC